jgi:hypothetical protein
MKVVGGVTVDLSSGKKSKSRVDSITMSIDNYDYDLHFELTDEFPGLEYVRVTSIMDHPSGELIVFACSEWLASDTLELQSQIANESINGEIITTQRRRSTNQRSINLPERTSEAAYQSTVGDDFFGDTLEGWSDAEYHEI